MRVTQKMVGEARRKTAREIDDLFALDDQELLVKYRGGRDRNDRPEISREAMLCALALRIVRENFLILSEDGQ